MATSEELGTEHLAELSVGPIAYRERGDGPPVVFIHGLLVNADLWRNVSPTVAAAGYRCIAPDWPLGSHQHPLAPGTDFRVPALADLVVEFLDKLDLHDVTLVANDTGGAITQVLLANHPDRVAQVVLTSCDSFECFLPPILRPLQWLAAIPGATWLLVQSVRPRFTHRLPITFGWLSKRPMPAEIVDSYLEPTRHSHAIQREVRRLLRGIDNQITLDAAEKLANFDGRALIAWASEDRLFPLSLAYRLADVIPNANVAEVADSYTFIPEDQPAELSRLIVEFLAS